VVIRGMGPVVVGGTGLEIGTVVSHAVLAFAPVYS
jgi:hypothetical protein